MGFSLSWLNCERHCFSFWHYNKICVSSWTYFSEHIAWAWCRKPLKTLLVILGFILEFCLTHIHDWVLLIYSEFMFLLVLLLLLFRKFSKYLWSSNSTTHIMPESCLFSNSNNLSVYDFSWKGAWLSSTKRLNDFGAIFQIKVSFIAFHFNFCK